jgi:hypothetical protein
MGANLIRGLVLGLGVLIALGGLTAMAFGGPAGVAGIWAVITGCVFIVAALIERTRYRSAQAELSQGAPGPGGGEPTDQPMESRFRRTDERFIDPTTHVSMRVWIDPDTGERRYRAEE